MTSKVEALLERLLRIDKTPLYCAGGKCGFTEGKHIPTRAELEELVAEGVAEGAEQERHKWEAATLKALLNPDVSIADKLEAAGDPLACVSPFASVLAPTKEEP